MRGVTCDWIVKFAERIRATTDGSVPLSPIQASKQSEAHEELLKRVIASVRRLRIDLDVSKPVNFYELSGKLKASRDLSERMVLKDCLWRLGCIVE
jgi:hypothetical protein